MPVDLKHLSASTRDKVNKVLDAYADAHEQQRELLDEGIRVVLAEGIPHVCLRVELFDPVEAREPVDLGPEFGLGMEIGGGEDT